MKNNRLPAFLLFSSLCGFVGSNSFAQTAPTETNLTEGSHVGGGGLDILFTSIRKEIEPWLAKKAAAGKLETDLKLNGISGSDLVTRFEAAVASVDTKIIFNHDIIKFGENVRICKNDRDTSTITCNIKEWNEANGKVKYAIVFHEYLGIAEIENNLETDYSRFPISSNIVGFVASKESFELGMEKVVAKSCQLRMISVIPVEIISVLKAKHYDFMNPAADSNTINFSIGSTSESARGFLTISDAKGVAILPLSGIENYSQNGFWGGHSNSFYAKKEKEVTLKIAKDLEKALDNCDH